jgi:hypothetical protein
MARAHQQLVWDRQRLVNRLRSSLREFYPSALAALGTDLAHPDAVAILERAPRQSRGGGYPAPLSRPACVEQDANAC